MPRRPWMMVSLLLVLPVASSRAEDETAALLKDVKAVGREGAGSPAARAAWEKLVAQGPAVLPRILEAMDTPDTVAVNWLGTAFDRIAGPEIAAGGKRIDTDALLAFAKDSKHQGRPRRLALETVEQLRPGTRERLVRGWLDDVEFRYEAVEQKLAELEKTKDLPEERLIADYRQAFDATRDLGQAREVARRLQALDVTVSVADHFGFLRDWYVIGPFDAHGMKGFKTAYPPETKVDLGAELLGKNDKKLRWKRFTARETPAGTHVALVNLREPLGDAEDAVAYAYTAFTVPEAREVEFRGAADDNLTVWVNSERVFGFEEYRNGVRLDRHRFRVRLKAGVNTVLLKVCQAPLDPTSPEPNWEFLLRIADATGKGVVFKGALPLVK